MALAIYHTQLEYATNTLEFRLSDDAGGPINFPAGTTFNITRLDGTEELPYTVERDDDKTLAGYIRFVVTPPDRLKREGDSVSDFENRTYEHSYSVKESGTNVFLTGKLNLVVIA